MRPVAAVRAWELLKEADFRRLLVSQFSAQAADGLAQAAFTFALVLEPLEQNAPARILALFAITLLPYSAVSPFMGVFVDRWPRRSLLVGTALARVVLLASLPLWGSLAPGDTALFPAILVILALGRLFLTTKGALLPVLLHERDLLRGNALSAGGGMVSALAGGVVGLGLAGSIGSGSALVGAGIAYAGAAFAAGTLSTPFEHARGRTASITGAVAKIAMELVEGFRVIWANAAARLALTGVFLVRTAGMVVVIAAILVIRHEYPAAEDAFGKLSSSALALGAAGVGAFSAALAAPWMNRRLRKPELILSGFVIAGVGISALGGVADIYAVLMLSFLGGFGTFVTKVAVDASVQEALPDEMRGRAFALYDILYNIASVVAGIVMVTFQSTPLRSLLILTGIATLVLAALLAASMRRTGVLARA